MAEKMEWVRVSSTGLAPCTIVYNLIDEKGKVIATVGYATYSDGKKWHLFDKILLVYRKGRKKEEEFNNFEELNERLKRLGLPEF